MKLPKISLKNFKIAHAEWVKEFPSGLVTIINLNAPKIDVDWKLVVELETGIFSVGVGIWIR